MKNDVIEEWSQWRDARLCCCKCIGQGQTTGHSFTACNCITVDQIHTKFSINHGKFVVNVKSQFIWMCWKMKWRHLTKDITITSDEWQQFVFFYCITNWNKHLQLQNSYTLSTFWYCARQLNMCSMCPPFCRTTNSIQRHHSLTFWRRHNFDRWWI